jgi:LmbE family N-acetylglucosaminyl deacetylase
MKHWDMKKKILVISAHPDDDVIGCGGSLAKHIAAGNEVAACYMTSGEGGSIHHSKDELMKIRENEARNAAKIIGFQNLTFLRLPDGDIAFNKENISQLIELMLKEKPNIIYTHYERDFHRDHVITYQLAFEAVKGVRYHLYQEYRGEPWPTNALLQYEVVTPIPEINYLEDISPFIEKKIAAVREHKSQLKNIHYDEAARCLARYRAITTMTGEYCEMFKISLMANIF